MAAAGLLCGGLAGCGAAAAATSPPASGVGGVALAAARETGCASVHQASSVTVTRYLLVSEPVNGGTRTYTQRNATKVRALFRDLCAALAHADTREPRFPCTTKFADTYAGTFYDRKRILATFGYSLTGCPRLSLTASGKTRSTFAIGKAAAAAPNLNADLAAVLGVPVSQV
ncbi:MAG TPA: hypothetical protein VIX15_04275 [Streptosporangiaceae bacterium]